MGIIIQVANGCLVAVALGCSLFLPHRNYWIHTHGPDSGQEAGQRRYPQQQQAARREGQRVGGADRKQERLHHPG